jgi:hypothetical protein
MQQGSVTRMVRLVSLPLAPHRAKPIRRRTVKAKGSAPAHFDEEGLDLDLIELGLAPRLPKKSKSVKASAKRNGPARGTRGAKLIGSALRRAVSARGA